MGKIRTRIIGLEDVEEKQKKAQKERSAEKKEKKTRLRPAQRDSGEAKKEEAPAERDEATRLRATEQSSGEVKKEKKEKKIMVHSRGKPASTQRGEQYSEAKKKVNKDTFYSLDDAIKLLKKIKFTSFDESVELHLVVDEAGLKGEIELPHSTGKTTRIKIVDDGVITNLEKGVMDFDILITHPSFMPKLAKFARVLGPKGLMPNPKAGTISPNPEEVAKKFQKGVLRWKTEAKFPLIHQMIGKISFEDKDIVENAKAFLESVKKNHIKKAFLKSTMSPSVKIDIEKV